MTFERHVPGHCASASPFRKGVSSMLHRFCLIGLLAVVIAGCTGNFKFDDKDYRPLGEPQQERSEKSQ